LLYCLGNNDKEKSIHVQLGTIFSKIFSSHIYFSFLNTEMIFIFKQMEKYILIIYTDMQDRDSSPQTKVSEHKSPHGFALTLLMRLGLHSIQKGRCGGSLPLPLWDSNCGLKCGSFVGWGNWLGTGGKGMLKAVLGAPKGQCSLAGFGRGSLRPVVLMGAALEKGCQKRGGCC
jgi:hypothetical protein